MANLIRAKGPDDPLPKEQTLSTEPGIKAGKILLSPSRLGFVCSRSRALIVSGEDNYAGLRMPEGGFLSTWASRGLEFLGAGEVQTLLGIGSGCRNEPDMPGRALIGGEYVSCLA